MKGSSAGDKTVLFIFKTRELINEWLRFVRSFVDGNAHKSKSIIETFLSALKEILNALRTIKLWTVINATKDRFTRSILPKSKNSRHGLCLILSHQKRNINSNNQKISGRKILF